MCLTGGQVQRQGHDMANVNGHIAGKGQCAEVLLNTGAGRCRQRAG